MISKWDSFEFHFFMEYISRKHNFIYKSFGDIEFLTIFVPE